MMLELRSHEVRNRKLEALKVEIRSWKSEVRSRK